MVRTAEFLRRQIGRQHGIIWDLDQAKQDTAKAWSLLIELETAQALHITHRDQIIKALKRPSAVLLEFLGACFWISSLTAL
jgi:hypothetical protein